MIRTVRLRMLAVLLVLFATVATSAAWAATYYSQGSVAPNVTGNWNSNRGGGGASPANFTSGDVFVVQSPHIMTTSAAWSVSGTGSKVWIESGGTLTATSAITLAAATTFQIDAGGTYVHSNTSAYGSTVFQGTEVFDAASTVVLNNSNTTGPGNVAFGNLTINFTSDPGGAVNSAGVLTTINGNLTVVSTSTREFRFVANTPTGVTYTIAKDLVIQGGTLNFSSGSATGTLNLGGNYNQSGGTLTTAGAVTIAFSGGASNATFTQSAGTLTNANFNWSIGAGKTLTLNSTLNVAGTLVLGSGKITTGGNKVSLGAGVNVTRTSGYVNGTLEKTVPTGGSTTTFEIGDASSYTPVTVPFASVSASGLLSARTTGAAGPPPAGSLLSTSKYVNRSWTLTNNGVAFTTCSATFNFVSGDLVGSPNTSAMLVAKNTGGTWSNPTVGTRTSTSTQATGLTAFSDFWLGETGVYTITASAGAGGSISPSGAVTVPSGGNQTFTITPNTCFEIADVVVDGVSLGPTGSYPFFNVTANHTISATFSALGPYTIAASAGAGGTITPSGNISVACGGNQTFTIAADGCHTIANVTVNGVPLGAAPGYTFFNVMSDQTITATFALINYTIAASAGTGGSISPSGNVPVGCGSGQTFSIAADACYELSDVVVDGGSVGAVSSYSFSNVQASHSIAASFSPLGPYSITASAGAGGSISPSGTVSVNCGADQTFLIAGDDCHAIAGVLVDGNPVGAVSSYTFSNVTTNHTIAASFTLNVYTITASAGAGGTISPSGAVAVNCGENQSFTIATDACFHIDDVEVDGGSVGAVTSYTFSNVTTDHTITAYFAVDVFTITASAGTGGSISPNGAVAVNCGSSQTFSVSPSPCYVIAGVLVDGGSVGAVSSYTFSNVTANHTIAASFQIITYTISALAGGGGTITPFGPVAVNCGASQSFTIASDGCHTIGDVVVDGNSVGPVSSYSFSNVAANHTIGVGFNIVTYTIAASAGSGGSIVPSGSVVVNCNGGQSFNITPDVCFHVADVVVDGGSVGAVASYLFASVTANHTIAAKFAANVPTITAVTALTAAQLKLGNDTNGTTKITVTFTPPSGTASVEVYRKGFGGYPAYDDAGGAVPSAPAAYPPAGWTLTGVTASGQTDEPATRDFWYYVAYAKDACGNASPVSTMTGGALNYHLGDVSNGIAPGNGDNKVATSDLSLLGSHYGLSGAALAAFQYLDVGPTTDHTSNARPTTDAKTDFEDLVMFAVNFTPAVSVVAKGGSRTLAVNALAVNAPGTVSAGDEFDVPVVLSGAGNLLALSVTLGWNPGVVEPIGVIEGQLVTSLGGVVFSPGPGRADATLLGEGSVMTGTGDVAVVRFRAVASGEPHIGIASVIGRDSQNQDVAVSIQSTLAVEASVVGETELSPVVPNPAPGHAVLGFALASPGHADLSIYSVDGRRVKTLARGEFAAGRHVYRWDGTDDRGVAMRSGVFFVQLDAPVFRRTRTITLVR